jgi:hypothetical protein
MDQNWHIHFLKSIANSIAYVVYASHGAAKITTKGRECTSFSDNFSPKPRVGLN